MYIKYLFLIIASNLLLNSLSATDKTKIPPETPRLVVGIVIEQMRYDYLTRYWDNFGNDGFKRLVDEGFFFKNARFDYQFTQSGPGMATIVTGTNPSIHGIVSDTWYDRLRDVKVSSTQDGNTRTVEGSFEEGMHSPARLLSSTIGDELKLSNKFKSKVISVSMNAPSAVLLGGHTANAAYWYDNVRGSWITGSYYGDTLPGWVKDFNEKKLPDIYLEREWNMTLASNEYIASLPDDSKYETGFGGKKTFPYNLSRLSKLRGGNKDYRLLSSTPFGITFTKDFAISAIVNENLGADETPDILLVSFSPLGNIGKLFGPNSVEMEDTYIRLDKELAHFLNFIDNHLGQENVLIFLTSNHGIASSPAYLKDNRIPSGIFNPNQTVSLLSSYLNAIYGRGDWVKHYNNLQIYLNHKLIEDSKIPLDQFQAVATRFLIQFSGVANVISSATLHENNFQNGAFSKMQNSFSQKRSGDIIINLEPGWVERTENATNNNSYYTYDAHVPLLWYGWKIRRGTIYRPVSMVDIAPTIANMLNIFAPNASMGSPLLELLD